MTHNPTRISFARGERLDLYITKLRDEAEDAFGTAFAEAAALSCRIDDPDFTNEEFDAAVIGLVCSVILKTRPLPKYVRKTVGLLLQVTPEERAELIPVPVAGRASSVQARTDRATLDFVIDNLKDQLYSPHAFAGPFTDLGCGLGGLSLTWRRDILSEADADGVITLDGLKRIRRKLTTAIVGGNHAASALLLDHNGKAIARADTGVEKENERRVRLVEVVERAVNIGSTIECVPSRVREERISQAYARHTASTEKSA
jgi:hypothetical protein